MRESLIRQAKNLTTVRMEDGGVSTLPRAITLAAGDVAALLAFAAIGRVNHSEGVFILDVIGTASPYIIGRTSSMYMCPDKDMKTRCIMIGICRPFSFLNV